MNIFLKLLFQMKKILSCIIIINMIDKILEFIKNNYEWLLSGIGTNILFFFLGRKSGYNKAIRNSHQKIKSGNDSQIIQAGGDVTLNV